MRLILALIPFLLFASTIYCATSYDFLFPGNQNPSYAGKRSLTCTPLTCVPVGEPCNPSSGDICVGSDSFCNQTRGSSSAICSARLPNGGQCIQNVECISSFCDFSGSSGVCADPDFGSSEEETGSPCTSYADCTGGQACISNRCTGAAIGEDCGSLKPCAFGGFCQGARCVASIPEGEVCPPEGAANPCTPFHLCVPTEVSGPDLVESKCFPFFSQPVGALCRDRFHCQDNLACVSEEDNSWGVCTEVSRSTGTLCDSISDCVGDPDFVECTCNLTSGVNTCQSPFRINPDGIGQAYDDLATCSEANCQVIFPFECEKVNCLNELCDALDLTIAENLEQTFPLCYLENLNSELLALCRARPPTQAPSACGGFCVVQERTGGVYVQDGETFRIYDISVFNNGSCPITAVNVAIPAESGNIDQHWNFNPQTGGLTLFPNILPEHVYSSAGFIIDGQVLKSHCTFKCESCSPQEPPSGENCNVAIEVHPRANGNYKSDSHEFQVYDLSIFNNLGGTRTLRTLVVEIHPSSGDFDQKWNLQLNSPTNNIVFRVDLFGGLSAGGVYSQTSGFIIKYPIGQKPTITSRIISQEC